MANHSPQWHDTKEVEMRSDDIEEVLKGPS